MQDENKSIFERNENAVKVVHYFYMQRGYIIDIFKIYITTLFMNVYR